MQAALPWAAAILGGDDPTRQQGRYVPACRRQSYKHSAAACVKAVLREIDEQRKLLASLAECACARAGRACLAACLRASQADVWVPVDSDC